MSESGLRIGPGGVYIPELGMETPGWCGEPYKTMEEAENAMREYAARFPAEWIKSMYVEYDDPTSENWVEGSFLGWRPLVWFYTSKELAERQPPVVVITEEQAGFPWWILLAFLPFM